MKNLKKISALFFGILVCNFLSTSNLSAQNTKTLTDPEIASIAVTANQIDVDYAHIALKKTKNKDVRNFAKTMETDHNTVIKLAVELATKLHVTPKDNAVTQSLLKDAAKTKAHLNSLKGKAFDKAYVDNEAAFHKAVIGTVETVLIPQSSNSELKALLTKAVPTFKTHYEHALMIQKGLK